MLIPTWPSLATQALNRLESTNTDRVAVLGIGNELNGDDGVGIKISQELSSRYSASRLPESIQTRLILSAGLVPENFTGHLRRFRPDIVILIDAADMGCEAGCVNWLHWEQTIGMSASTHSLPLSLVAQYLVTEIGCKVYIIAIQACANEFCDELSPQVADAASGVVHTLGALLFARV